MGKNRLPEGWKMVSLLDCGDILNGLTYSPENVKPYGLLVLRSSNIQNEKLSFEDCVFVDSKIEENQYVKKGDILICVRNGSEELIGKCALIDDNYIATFGAFMSVFRGENTDYIFQIFRSGVVQKQIRNNSNATINQITKRDFAEIIIPTPEIKEEQAAIAEALSDVDTLTENLEKLIVKKQGIKQGAMQELLTGKRRLPGFDERWIEKRIGDIGNTYSGLTGKRKENFGTGKAQYITFLNVLLNTVIDTESLDNVDVTENENQNTVRRGDMFFNTSSETPEEVGMCAVLLSDLENTYLNSFCFGFRLTDKEINNLFLSYYFNSNCGRKIMILLAQGATRYNLSKSYFNDIYIKLPSLLEQTAIAAVLSDMDSEIEALTAKLEKTKVIKQGMMQELLSGRKRIWEKEENIIAFPSPKSKKTVASPLDHNQQYDDAVMIAGIVSAFYSDRYPLGRKKVQKLLYLLRRYQANSIATFKKKAAGPYAHEVRYKGGEPIARNKQYIETITTKGKGTIFKKGENIEQALEYIKSWGKQNDIQWLVENFLYTTGDKLELLATVDMAACDLKEAGTPVLVDSVKHLIATNDEWKAKLQKITFSDTMIAGAIADLKKLL